MAAFSSHERHSLCVCHEWQTFLKIANWEKVTNISDGIGLANEVEVLCVPGLTLGNTSKSQAGLPRGIQ